MANTFYERPILNSPYEKPRFHHPSMITVSRSGCRRSKRAGHRSSSFRFRRRGAGQRGHRAHRHSQPTATARSSARSAARRSRCAPPLGGSAPKTGHSPGIRTEVRFRSSLFRADSNPLSLSGKDRPAGGHSRGVAPSPKNFRKILDLSTRASRSGHGVVVLTNVTREKALARERANTSAALELTPSS